MKKLLIVSIVSLLVVACSDKKKEEGGSDKSAEKHALYEKNLATLKAGIAAFEKENMSGWSASVADSAKWDSPAYGDTVKTREHWMQSIQYLLDNWDNIKLTNSTFLPGLDSVTHDFDGSVRYYGVWEAVHMSGVTTHVNFYGTYEFNADNKIIWGSDYYDVGGLMNALKPKDQ